MAAAVFLCSCAVLDGDKPAGGEQNDLGTDNGLPRRKIIADSECGKNLRILKIDDHTLPTGRMKAEIKLRNKLEDAPFRFFYVFVWYTKSGKKIAPPPNRKVEVTLPSRRAKVISSVAPSADCVDFQVILNVSP